ncbi:restriction endonuclease [Pasteurella multocida]|uniref:restriction endonuclease n=1 Tax=Pasteurella multocida TaxID=747 RepID=UPI00397C8378
MKISALLLNDSELRKIQEKFYHYFKTGYDFEQFLKEYLIKMGLDEVEITKKSRDGGIDLTAVRKGVGDFSEMDTVNYFIQAKRYSLTNKISARTIRELKGTIPFGYKGMLICTSDFTDDAKKEAVNDPSKPIVIINGKSLVQSCIDHGIGFTFQPIFSQKQMDEFLNKDKVKEKSCNKHITFKTDANYVDKTITVNDIRARIISIPSSIIRLIPNSQKKVSVLLDREKKYELTIDNSRRYLGGVTKILREYNLLSTDNIITPKNAKWFFDKDQNLIQLIIEN